jgi:hypothetical protein
MADYTGNLRTLDCFECFDAKGKICSFKDDSTMI